MTGTAAPPGARPSARAPGRRPGRLRAVAVAVRAAGACWRSVAGVWRQGNDLELLQRAMGFAALGLVTLVPLLIVVAAVFPVHQRGFAQWVVEGMGLPARPAASVQTLFSAPRRVLSTTSAFSIVALALFGLSFAACVQTGYEKIWALTVGPWHRVWRRSVWLAALTAYLFVEAQSGAVLQGNWPQAALRIALTVLLGTGFFWWGQRFLLGARVGWRPLLPGAAFTMVGLVGLREFSSLIFSPLIVANAVTYGAVGTVLVVQSWLIGAGFVVFSGSLLGRHLHECQIHPAGSRSGDAPTRPEPASDNPA